MNTAHTDSGMETSFAMQLKAARRQARLTQQALARLSGLSKSYVSDLERGTSDPTVRVACQLADAMGLPVSDLLPEAGEAAARPPLSAPDVLARIRADVDVLAAILGDPSVEPL